MKLATIALLVGVGAGVGTTLFVTGRSEAERRIESAEARHAEARALR